MVALGSYGLGLRGKAEGQAGGSGGQRARELVHVRLHDEKADDSGRR